MPTLAELQSQNRALARLLAEHDYRSARAWITEHGHAHVLPALDHHAAAHWLYEAETACRSGARDRMNGCLAEAARFRTPDNTGLFRETRRQLRQMTLELTTAPHWAELLRVASYQRQQLEAGKLPARYQTFSHPRLIESIGVDPLDLDRLEKVDLLPHLPTIADDYPTELRSSVQQAGAPFLRCAVWLAGARPDLAVIDLIELPDSNPAVCLDRARVAHALGLTGTAALALSDLVLHHGRHVTVRRLHTGVFLAQLLNEAGNPERAADLLLQLRHDRVGRRPILLLADLLDGLDRRAEAREVLEEWASQHPGDHEIEGRLGAL